jgi:hypothetical protein
VDPPPGVTFAVQRGRTELLPPSSISANEIVFELSIRADGLTRDGKPRFLGEYTQGPPDGRFIYVNSGTLAGQGDSCYTRRAKVFLAAITTAMLNKLARNPDACLVARFEGRGRDQGPACGAIRLLDGWSLQT